MKLQILIDLIKDNQTFLVKRILKYAKLYGYVKYTSTLEEPWVSSISSISKTLIDAIMTYREVPEILVDHDFRQSSICSFGIIEAQRHRKRGVTLEMFLSLMKYYRQSYLDLVIESIQDLEQIHIFELWINRYFDHNEIAFCSEWCCESKEKQEINERRKIEEQLKQHQLNELLEIIFENIREGIIVTNSEGDITYKNSSAIKMNYLSSIGDFNNVENYKILSIDGNPVKPEEFPIARTLSGECFSNYQLMVHTSYNGLKKIARYSGTPIYNENGKMTMTIITVIDMTEHINQQELLLKIEREKNEVLENSIKLRDEFLYLISHEFKTPLAVINLALQSINTIYRNQITNNMDKLISSIEQNTNRQLRLVNNLLEITQINSGNIKTQKDSFDIIYVLDSLVNAIQPIADKKEVVIRFTSKFNKKELFTDEEKVRRIILNLLSNALKFTPNGKLIDVSLSSKRYKNKNMISICVEDEGVGIPESKQALIFDKFGQVDTSLSRQAEGIGLGLYLVKLLLNELDGYIFLESEQGKGSKFTVLFPTTKMTQLEAIPSANNMNDYFIERENKMIKEIAIEFSDIYF